MKLSIKLAGLFSSGVFILTAVPGFFQQIKPTDLHFMLSDVVQGMDVLESLGFSLLGALVAGAIGYQVGDILSKPQGSAEPRKRGSKQNARQESSPVSVTGDETFLDDLESPQGDAPIPAEAPTVDLE